MRTIIVVSLSFLVGVCIGAFLALGFVLGLGAASGMLMGA